MTDCTENIENLKKYYRKLKTVIENDASFNFMGKVYVSKQRIDDIICCIDASFPKEYLDFIDKRGSNSLKSYVNYKKLLKIIKYPFFLNNSLYVFEKSNALSLINEIASTISFDIGSIYK